MTVLYQGLVFSVEGLRFEVGSMESAISAKCLGVGV